MANLVYKALADPTRREILRLLRNGGLTAGQLAESFPYAKPTLSRHFAVLQAADLIYGVKQGNTIVYRLKLSVLEEALMTFLQAIRHTPHASADDDLPTNDTQEGLAQ